MAKTTTSAMVKELRERTGAGMMDCKRALDDAAGDIDAAVEALRIKGADAAKKKAGRIAADGMIVCKSNEHKAISPEINSETDFVAKDESFQKFCHNVAEVLLANDIADLDELAVADLGGETVEAARQELITKIGEKISIRRFDTLDAGSGIVCSYLHGLRIGVLVKLSGGSVELGRGIAMHIAASAPLCISEAEMAPEILEKEKAIFVAQSKESGKPEDIIEKMVGGKMKKFLKENTLLEQPFVKDPEQTISQLVQSAGVTVESMVRYEVGEGLEKREDDFVSEVMAQAGKN